MRDKDKIPNITNDNEQEYWQEFKNTQSPYIREALIIKYSPLVKYEANRIYVNMSSHENMEILSSKHMLLLKLAMLYMMDLEK